MTGGRKTRRRRRIGRPGRKSRGERNVVALERTLYGGLRRRGPGYGDCLALRADPDFPLPASLL